MDMSSNVRFGWNQLLAVFSKQLYMEKFNHDQQRKLTSLQTL